jgi:hypothetical protein
MVANLYIERTCNGLVPWDAVVTLALRGAKPFPAAQVER